LEWRNRKKGPVSFLISIREAALENKMKGNFEIKKLQPQSMLLSPPLGIANGQRRKIY